jgi:hypothetical protein
VTSSAFKILCGAAILATVPLKIAAGTAAEPLDPESLKQRIIGFLQSEDFDVLPFDETKGPFIEARSAECRLGVTEALPQGWNRDGLRLLVPEGDRLFFVYDGTAYPELPTRRTAIRYQWTRLARAFGIDAPWLPSLAVTASAGCDARLLPWSELAVIP